MFIVLTKQHKVHERLKQMYIQDKKERKLFQIS